MDAEHIADLTFRDSTLDDLVDWVIPVIECDLQYRSSSNITLSRNRPIAYGNVLAYLFASLINSTALFNRGSHWFLGNHTNFRATISNCRYIDTTI